jgi:N-acetylmuramate 1-kinase
MILPNRRDLSHAFLRTHGWAEATRTFLAGDASDRSYDRLIRGEGHAVLMDAPPGKGDDPATFLAVAAHLRGIGLSVPAVLASDLDHGFLLLEDLGDAVFARALQHDPHQEVALYTAAVDAILRLQSAPPMAGLPDLSASDWAIAALVAVKWYASGIVGHQIDAAPLHDALLHAHLHKADGPRVVIHRDYHAENLIWLPDRAGVQRVGILDFQLLQMGQPVYDLVSLLQDARRDVTTATVAAMKRYYQTKTGQSDTFFETAYAIVGVQRALRIIGVFARLCLMSGKAHYLDLIPRVWGQLQVNLSHPALEDLRDICEKWLPAPTLANLSLLKEKCGTVAV